MPGYNSSLQIQHRRKLKCLITLFHTQEKKQWINAHIMVVSSFPLFIQSKTHPPHTHFLSQLAQLTKSLTSRCWGTVCKGVSLYIHLLILYQQRVNGSSPFSYFINICSFFTWLRNSLIYFNKELTVNLWGGSRRWNFCLKRKGS